jgi:hypothetical protein
VRIALQGRLVTYQTPKAAAMNAAKYYCDRSLPSYRVAGQDRFCPDAETKTPPLGLVVSLPSTKDPPTPYGVVAGKIQRGVFGENILTIPRSPVELCPGESAGAGSSPANYSFPLAFLFLIYPPLPLVLGVYYSCCCDCYSDPDTTRRYFVTMVPDVREHCPVGCPSWDRRYICGSTTGRRILDAHDDYDSTLELLIGDHWVGVNYGPLDRTACAVTTPEKGRIRRISSYENDHQ